MCDRDLDENGFRTHEIRISGWEACRVVLHSLLFPPFRTCRAAPADTPAGGSRPPSPRPAGGVRHARTHPRRPRLLPARRAGPARPARRALAVRADRPLGRRRRDRRLRAARACSAPGEDPFGRLEDLPAARGDAEVGGGWFGWLGYGLGARVEALPPRPPRPFPLPDAHLAFYDNVLRQDTEGRWWFEALDEDRERAARRSRATAARRRRSTRGSRTCARCSPPRPSRRAPAPTDFALRAPGAAGHVAAVAECVERIAAGEIFQANLCLRLDATYDGDVAELYAHAAPQLQPAYGACFVTPWGGVASLSPELFLRRRGRDVTTGPIKGTAPRDGDPAALRDSAKDRAEHVMIVDLMRNDLGRVAEYG